MLQAVFCIEQTKLHYIRGVGNYQQRTATMRSTHTFVVEISIYFGGLERHAGRFSVTRATRASEYSVESAVVEKRDEQYFACLSKGTTLE